MADLTDIFRILAVTSFLAAPVPVLAGAEQGFSCSNPVMEIRCADGRCDFIAPDDGFTPMQLRRTQERLTICAYSGCWSGPIAVRHAAGGITMLQGYVSRDGDAPQADDEEPELLSVIHDAGNRTAQMNWAGFANVMLCDPAP